VSLLGNFSGEENMMIDVEEYLQRVKRLRGEMASRGLEALLFYSWKRGQIPYISGYYPNYIANVAMVLLPKVAEPAMLIRFPFDLERARTASWIQDIRASGNVLNMAQHFAEACKKRNILTGRIGLVTGDNVMDEMPRSLSEALHNEMDRITWVEAGDLIQSARLIKSPAEFDALRRSARLADFGARAASKAIQPGRSEYEIVAAAEGEMRRRGADAHLVVIASKGETELIGPPEDKTLEVGDNVIVEIAVQVQGYWTQTAQVFYVGGPNSDQSKIYRDTYLAYKTAVETIRPGVPCSDVAQAIKACLERAGYSENIEQDFGHGIGLDLPEPPRIELKDNTVIREGMVLVVHPAVRKPGTGGAFIGGTVLVHADRTETLHEITEISGKGD
jgi:Xaa-Pro dipeptidase